MTAPVLDHILWAAPDLDAGSDTFFNLTGVRPAPGGSHPGLGTRNSLVSLGEGLYLEIISPDPAQEMEGTLGAAIAAMPRPGLIGFALRSKALGDLVHKARNLGLGVRGPTAMSRAKPDGSLIAWSILNLDPVDRARLGFVVPFALDWGSTPHPSMSTPKGATLQHFTALHDSAEEVAALYASLGVAVPVTGALKPGLLAILDTPKGEVALLSLHD